MKLFRISQSVNTGWYTYDSAVVVANTIEEARRIIPSPFYFYDNGFYYMYKNQEPIKEKLDPSWCSPKNVKVALIGEHNYTVNKFNPGEVITASFNAGFDESRYLDMRRIGREIASGRKSESGVQAAIEALQAIELQLHDKGLAELRYHLIEANRTHDVKRVQEYELKLRDYMDQEYEDWS